MKTERLLVLGVDGGDPKLFPDLGMRVLKVLERRGRVAALQRIWREDRGWSMILCGQDGRVSGGYYWAQVPETYLFKPQFGGKCPKSPYWPA